MRILHWRSEKKDNNMVEKFFLQLDQPSWLFFLASLLIIAISYAYYWRTLPPLGRLRRMVAVSLRSAVLIIVLFLVLDPLLQLLYRYSEKPVVAVLVDNSASMKLQDGRESRREQIKGLLDYFRNGLNSDSLEIRLLAFDLNTRSLGGDSLQFRVDGTNISQGLQFVADSLGSQNLQAIVLASDGLYNHGGNPLSVLPAVNTPVYTVLIGDTALPHDLAIRRVHANAVSYVGKEAPVEIVFTQNGYDGQRARLSIRSRGKEVAHKWVRLSKSGFEQKEQLPLLLKQPGDQTFTVEIQPLEGETTSRNNRRPLQIRVLKSKFKILVVSGGPDYDRHFLSFLSRELPDFEFTFRTEKQSGRYYEGDWQSALPDSQDLFILQGFPTAASSAKDLQQILDQVQRRKVALWWLINRRTDLGRLPGQVAWLPFKNPGPFLPVPNAAVQLSPGGQLHPITRIEENESSNNALWKRLPPLEVYAPLRAKAGSRALLRRQEDVKNAPGNRAGMDVAFVYRQGEIKQFVFNGANFSRWHFEVQDDPELSGFMVTFLNRTLRWLVNKDDIQQIQIAPSQRIYNVGETVEFSGQVYDEFYQPIPDARVQVEIIADSLEVADELNRQGNGFYQQNFPGLPEGTYQYRVRAEKNGVPIGERKGQFTVVPFFLEFQRIPADRGLMAQLARQSGGKLLRPDQLHELFRQSVFTSRARYHFSEKRLFQSWYWLALVLLLLSLEWFLRKRWGLL